MIAAGEGPNGIGNGLPPHGQFEPLDFGEEIVPTRQFIDSEGRTLSPARLQNPGLDRNLHSEVSMARRIVYRVRTVLAGWRRFDTNDFLPVRSAGGSNIEYRIQLHRPDTESEAMRIVVRGNFDDASLFLQLLTRRANVARWGREEIRADLAELIRNGEWLAMRVADSKLHFFLFPTIDENGRKYAFSIWWDTADGYPVTSSTGKGKIRGDFIERTVGPRSQMDDTAFQLALRDFRSDITPARGTPSPVASPSVTGLVGDTGETSGGANLAGAAHVHPATRSTAGRTQRRYGHTQLAGACRAIQIGQARTTIASPAARPTMPVR